MTNCTVSGNSTSGSGGGVSTGGFGYDGFIKSSGTTTQTDLHGQRQLRQCAMAAASTMPPSATPTVTGTNVKDKLCRRWRWPFSTARRRYAKRRLQQHRQQPGPAAVAGGNGIGGGICSSGGSVALSSSALTSNTATGGDGASGQASGDGIGGGLAS